MAFLFRCMQSLVQYESEVMLAKSGIDLSPALTIPEQQTAFGLSGLPIYEEYLSDIMQEVRGLADGLGQR